MERQNNSAELSNLNNKEIIITK